MADPQKKPGPLDGVMAAMESALEEMVGKPLVAKIKADVQSAVARKGVPPWSDLTDKINDQPSVADEAERGLFQARVRRLVREVEYKKFEPGRFTMLCERDKKDPQGRLYLQVQSERPDAVTGEPGVGRGRKAYLSEHMIDDEILRLMFSLFQGYEEHEIREGFLWRGRAIFGPHISSAALWEVADKMDFRRE